MKVKIITVMPEGDGFSEAEIGYKRDGEEIGITRVEVDVEASHGKYKAILLDADDSFDIIVEEGDERDIVWSAVKDPE